MILVPGLFAESHGILNNFFYSKEKDLEFTVGAIGNDSADHTADPGWWTDHIPIWTTAQEYGKTNHLPIRDGGVGVHPDLTPPPQDPTKSARS